VVINEKAAMNRYLEIIINMARKEGIKITKKLKLY